MAVLRQYGDLLEADLEREYGRDLCDFWRGRMTARKLRVLINGLPGDSPTQRALAEVPDHLAGWSLTDLMLGRLVDEFASYRWEFGYLHTEEKQRKTYRDPPSGVLPTPPALRVKASQVAARDDIPVISPHRLGGFVNGDDLGGDENP